MPNARLLAGMAPVAVVLFLGPVTPLGAETTPEPNDPAAATEDGIVKTLDALSIDELKAFYLRCARESVRGRLGGGEIAICSIGYERLLQRNFGGDFRALLEWRRNAHKPGTDPLSLKK